jgi:hypothetical protein
MSASFAFDVDPGRNLIRIRMGGFFTPDDITAFLESRNTAHRQLTCAPNQHVTLNDLRDMKIQSQEAVDAFRELLADPAYRSRRLAFVMGKTLARTQLFRALDARAARCFEDAGEAESWLLGSDEARAA